MNNIVQPQLSEELERMINGENRPFYSNGEMPDIHDEILRVPYKTTQ